jgi:pimeloyl-ACP methyl ester carboxylesterase
MTEFYQTALMSRTFSQPGQMRHYLESGPVDGPLMIFLHDWPSLGLMWRAHLDAFA